MSIFSYVFTLYFLFAQLVKTQPMLISNFVCRWRWHPTSWSSCLWSAGIVVMFSKAQLDFFCSRCLPGLSLSILCVCVLYQSVYMQTTNRTSDWEGQKMASEPLELESETLYMSYHVGAGNWIHVFQVGSCIYAWCWLFGREWWLKSVWERTLGLNHLQIKPVPWQYKT